MDPYSIIKKVKITIGDDELQWYCVKCGNKTHNKPSICKNHTLSDNKIRDAWQEEHGEILTVEQIKDTEFEMFRHLKEDYNLHDKCGSTAFSFEKHKETIYEYDSEWLK